MRFRNLFGTISSPRREPTIVATNASSSLLAQTLPLVQSVETAPGEVTTEASCRTAEPIPAHRPSVVVLEGIYHLQLAPDLLQPFLKDGIPLQILGEGWHFASLYIEFLPVILFELKHDDGSRATWFFDSQPRFIGHALSIIPEHDRRVVLRKGSALIESLLATVAGDSSAASLAVITRFFDLSHAVRLDLQQSCQASSDTPPHIAILSELPDQILTSRNAVDSPTIRLSRAALLTSLTTDFQDRLMVGLAAGSLSWPSPVDGTIHRCSAALYFHLFSFAYRVAEERSGLVYFLLVSQHKSALLGLYFPTENLIITADEGSRTSLAANFPAFHNSFRNYVFEFGNTLLPSLLRSNVKGLANAMRETHLGHQLWNEFSGLEDIVADMAPDRYPLQLSLGGSTQGAFGPLADIFPELADKIPNDISSLCSIIEFANQRDLLLVRVTRLFVSKKLRNRILDYMSTTQDFKMALAQREPCSAPVILIGLRVENRTVIDLAEFLPRMIAYIAHIAPGSTIVLDGQNRRFDQTPVGSFADFRAARSPLDVEAEICLRAIANAELLPITIVTTSGQTIATSLGWLSVTDCFISIWGAGLAKYRWISNKPGLVLSSRHHLLNPQEMAIYHSPEIMEDPAPISYADPACVEDDPHADQLIPADSPDRFSFRVREDLFFAEVGKLLAPYIHATARRSS